MDNIYNKLSEERKRMQAEGNMPSFFTTAGWQLFKEKYLYNADTPREQYERIATTAAKHTDNPSFWAVEFFNILWKGWLSPATPVLSNMGTDRGLPVSCSGTYIEDSIDGFYQARHEVAVLTKEGFGTSSYLGDIRPRGSMVSKGFKAAGVLPVFKGFVQDMRDVAQGSNRRGAWAGYIEIEHGDFYELADYIEAYPDDANIGWIISDEFIAKLNSGDVEAIKRYQRAMKMKMVTGKGYFFFTDKVNKHQPAMYKDTGKRCKASQLCSEILLHSDEEYTYTCVLSSMNLAKWDEWKDTDAVFVATVFLDCVASEFIEKAKKLSLPVLDKAIKFTEESRALGLGACGLHTLFQQKMIAFESLEAHMLNTKIFKHVKEQAMKASQWMAKEWGEPDWCKGYGVRNTHLLAIAPTKSTALIMGGISEGINPDPAMTFTQMTAAGEVDRANPTLLAIMKERNVYDKKHMQEITDAQGSVQGVGWLTDDEKLVFKTAFEINQEVIIRLASTRQKSVCQGQSLNLFFSSEEDEEYISKIHQQAFLDENILTLYYCYSKAGVAASKDECIACQ